MHVPIDEELDQFKISFKVTLVRRLGSGCGALVEWSLPTPEIRGLDPIIGNIIYYQLYLKKLHRKSRKQRKRGRERVHYIKNI